MKFWSTNLGGDVCSITKYISIWKLHWGMADDDSISITLIAFEYFEHFWILLNTLPTSNSWRGLWRTSLKQWCSLLVSPSSRSSMWWVCGDDHDDDGEDYGGLDTKKVMTSFMMIYDDPDDHPVNFDNSTKKSRWWFCGDGDENDDDADDQDHHQHRPVHCH